MAGSRLDRDFRKEERGGFWKRQFQTRPTRSQIIFDVLFGAVAPVLCFTFDPFVFKDGFGGGLLRDYQMLVYLASALEIIGLVTWMIWGSKAPEATTLFGGILIAGAVVSGVIGLAILPFSLLGLLFLIGALGFIPFVTSFVYLRNARRAFTFGRRYLTENAIAGGAVLGFIIALGAPFALSYGLSSVASASVNQVLFADAANADLAADRLRYLRFVSINNLDPIVRSYADEKDLARKEQLKRRYERITGNDIEARLQRLND